ncbi:CRISPR-associated endonuclease Cas1 [Leucothrix pacifica]|uniref:CRISPR-associated endonuclease Cas1 n=1 Tax=Leucothrix pacifica TaxID=1247513 RepID=A0A317CIP8_9GAMM|nr:CRISPR-associated endonuclease Cas1 [Leucothrix pacifica]PWQ98147.1 CRISPR-associated endonuclease Cas1 [Leucothrix pacifica]
MMLILDKRDTVLRYETGSLRIERKGERLQRVPIKQLEQVIIFGNAMVESNVWRYLADESVSMVIMSARGAPKAAFLHGSLATQLPFRRMQHSDASSDRLSLIHARYFVRLKFQSYALSVQTLTNHYDVEQEALNGFLNQQSDTLKRLDEANSVSSLMGLEGQLAHAWFVLLAHSLPYRWKFAGRNRRPPRDPLNSLLSLCYTLVSSEVNQSLLASGFDPSLGFLHQDTPGRESLVLDFVEIFRSAVDSFALQWLAEAPLDDSSFYYRQKEGCRLSKASRPLFFKAWSQYRYEWPRPILNDDATVESIIDWPRAEIREVINGQIMQWRELLKENHAVDV